MTTEPTPINPEQPWAQAPQQPYQYPYPPQPPAPKTNGMAIASMVLGICAMTIGWLLVLFGAAILAIIAVVFGHIATTQIGRDPQQRGRGMAIAGLVLGYIALGLFVILIGVVTA